MDYLVAKSQQEGIQRSLLSDLNNLKRSQFLSEYESKLMFTTLDNPSTDQIFSQHCIQHNEYTFEPFSYEAEHVITAFDYYRLHVKIGHFKLTVNVLCESRPNPLINGQSILGNNGTAYFVNFNSKFICVKSTNYHNQQSFHQRFPRVVKEWSIHKICSVLKCSPAVDPYFGFDIIVYTDCIQYAMERGKPIEKMTTEFGDILKKKLRTMHRLSIVHCDIKPENVLISQELDQPVFIDFGLSEIVSEKLGYKTLCAFRGTPNYCSPEMMGILAKKPEFVDLYYNDACGLESTIYKECIRFQPCEKKVEQLKLNENHQQKLFCLYAFKFHYLQQNGLQASKQLDKYIASKGNIKMVLLFMRQIINYVLIPSIFKKLLVAFSSLLEWKEIQYEMLHASESYLSKMHIFQTKDVREEPNNRFKDVLRIQSYDSKKAAQLPLGDDHNLYLDLLIDASEQTPYTLQQYLQMAFSCVRFDVRNLSLSEKSAIAIKVNKIILNHRNRQSQPSQLQPISELQHVRTLIKLILEQCLRSQPATKWAKDTIFDIFLQVIMLDIKTSNYVKEFISFVSKNFGSPFDTALALLQLMRINDAHRIILTQHFQTIQIVKKEIRNKITQLLQQLNVRSQSWNNPQMQLIHNIIKQYTGDQYQQNVVDYLKLKKELRLIRHSKIRKNLLYLMTARYSQKLFESSNNDYIFFMIAEMRRMLTNLDFFSSIKITIIILEFTKRYSDLKAYSEQICKIINCEEVFQRLNLDLGDIQDPARARYFTDNLQNFARQYSKIWTLNQYSYAQLREFILEYYKGGNIVNQEPKKWFIHLYPAFCQQFVSKCQNLDQSVRESYEEAMNLFEIAWFYYRLSGQTQGLLSSQIVKFQRKLEQTYNNPQKLQKRPLLMFVTYMFYYYNNQSQDNYLQSLEYLEKIISICKSLRLNRIAINFMKRYSYIANFLAHEGLIIYSSIQLFEFCLQEKNRFCSFYLEPANFNQAFTLFIVFARRYPQNVSRILILIIQFLRQHPVQSYFASLFKIIAHFLKKNPSYGHMIHIKHFRKDLFVDGFNPYVLIFMALSLKSEDGESQKSLLRTIALNVERVIWFVRKYILRQYFITVIDFLQEKIIRQRVGNFRMAKTYLSSKERKIYYRQIAKHNIRRRKEMNCIHSKVKKYWNMM